MIRKVKNDTISINKEYISPAFFYGTFVFKTVTMKRGNDNTYFLSTITREVPCKYQTRDEVIQVLRAQYNMVRNLNPNADYPEFEECLRHPHSESLDRQEKIDGLYITMCPKS